VDRLLERIASLEPETAHVVKAWLMERGAEAILRESRAA
jgi:hypothetical protein